MTVAPNMRHTKQRRCPICDGADQDPRGQGRRCAGFTSSDGAYVHCSREELAGPLDLDGAGTYAHRLHGPCKCGTTHGESTRPVNDVETAYSYHDEHGALLYQVVRKPGKRFLQRQPDGAGGWIWNMTNVQRVLYRLPELVGDDADRTVHVVEGEKDADTLMARGMLATCNPGGAGKWAGVAEVARRVLADRDVVVVADADDVGRRHAAEVASSLRSVARSIRVVEPPAPYHDVTDLLNAGKTIADLVPMDPDDAPPAEEKKPEPAPRYVIEETVEIAAPLPPLVWLCEGLRLARGSLTIVGGYGYGRKTLYAQALALAIASGKPALGVYSVVRAPVLHIDFEQGHRITRERYQRMARASGIDLGEITELRTVTFPPFRLTDPDARDVLRRLFEETRAGYVVVDSLKGATRGVDENSSEIREYIDVLGQEIKRVDAAGKLLHHAKKPGEGKSAARYSLRGSSAIFDAADGVFIFAGEKGEPTTVEHEKDRLIGTELPSFGLGSEDVERDGDHRWGLRVVHLEGAQMRQQDADDAAKVSAEARGECADKIRDYLRTLPDSTWKGNRTNLAKQVGGKHANGMTTIAHLVSTKRIEETTKGHTILGIRWVGP